MLAVSTREELFALHAVRRIRSLIGQRFALELDLVPLETRADDASAPHAPIVVGGRPCGLLITRGAGAALAPTERAWLTALLAAAADEIAIFLAEQESPTDRVPEHALERGPEGLVGSSPAMQAVYRVLAKVANSDATVLIAGENGTGKELVAKAIHQASPRRGRRFLVQNCSAFNDNLLDSELFGHRRGSFTGAVSDKPGLFAVADGGTFFLDEIGDMSAALQVKLLRVLQDGTFMPVGDTQPRQVDVRILAATNRDLAGMVARGEFREDLYYRVNIIHLTVPPLRERPEDMAPLVAHFLRKHARGRMKRLAPACLDRLLRYRWPGNVRELENEIERLVVLAGDARVIGEELISPRIGRAAEVDGSGESAAARGLPAAVEQLERKMILDALRRTSWNKTRAATDLAISRRNLIRLVQKYELSPPGRNRAD